MGENLTSKDHEGNDKHSVKSAELPIAVASDSNPYSFLISATASTTTFSPAKRGSRKMPKKLSHRTAVDRNEGTTVSGMEIGREGSSSPVSLHEEGLSNSPPQNPFKDIVKSDSQEL